MKIKSAFTIFFSLSMITFTNIVYAQNKQSIPHDFVTKVISEGKLWKAISYDKVQVSATVKPINRGYVLFREKTVEIVDQNNVKSTLQYKIEPGTVDPILKTEDGKEYEIRFYDKSSISVMRLRCIKSPDGLHYFEAISYMH